MQASSVTGDVGGALADGRLPPLQVGVPSSDSSAAGSEVFCCCACALFDLCLRRDALGGLAVDSAKHPSKHTAVLYWKRRFLWRNHDGTPDPFLPSHPVPERMSGIRPNG